MRALAVASSACYRRAMSAGPEQSRAERLALLRGLYAIVGDDEPLSRAEAAIAGGARVVQVRMKRSPAGVVLEAARRIVALAAGRALVLVNDRPDLALLAGADGVHVGEEDLPVAEARALVGRSLLVGRTARTLEEALAALDAGADHVGFGPVFTTRSKALDVAPRGIPALAATCAALPAPVVADGGVALDNISEVAAAGAAAAAVIGDLFECAEPRARAEALADAFARGVRDLREEPRS
jgi:thiamine-phosphate pyrophosphorylase